MTTFKTGDKFSPHKEEVINLINAYWRFTEDQQHASSWHDKQDLIKAIEEL